MSKTWYDLYDRLDTLAMRMAEAVAEGGIPFSATEAYMAFCDIRKDKYLGLEMVVPHCESFFWRKFQDYRRQCLMERYGVADE